LKLCGQNNDLNNIGLKEAHKAHKGKPDVSAGFSLSFVLFVD
jgi:hypothetical protein